MAATMFFCFCSAAAMAPQYIKIYIRRARFWVVCLLRSCEHRPLALPPSIKQSSAATCYPAGRAPTASVSWRLRSRRSGIRSRRGEASGTVASRPSGVRASNSRLLNPACPPRCAAQVDNLFVLHFDQIKECFCVNHCRIEPIIVSSNMTRAHRHIASAGPLSGL